ncbi:MAG: 50S ribosomal protein L35 [Ruminococcaceae bacterium]|nr:50S ribosomal protein L35 [Oscillospiraceae bacterium]
MGKIKSHKASAKRFTLTKSGKMKMNHMGRRHKTGLKASKRKRALRKSGYLSEATARNIKTIIPYA